MAPRSSSVVAALLLGAAIVLFVPAMADAAAAVPYGDFKYGEQLRVVTEAGPLLLLAIAILVMFAPLDGGSG